MHLDEYVVSILAKRRMEEAVRRAEQLRTLYLDRPPRRPARARLGMALIRFGHWMMGQSSLTPGTPIPLPHLKC